MYSDNVFSEEPDQKFYNNCLAPTVLIETEYDMSSGIVLRSVKNKDNEYHNIGLSTAHSVVKKNIKVRVGTYDKSGGIKTSIICPGIIYAVDAYEDLSVFLFLSSSPVPTATFDFTNKPFVGQEIYKVASGLGGSPRVDKGIISGLNRKVGPLKHSMQLSIYTVPGDSGSALFNKGYKIIGITKSIQTDRSNILYYNIGYATDNQSVTNMVRKASGGLDFVVNSKSDLPIIPFYEIKLFTFGKNPRPIPSNKWIK